MQERDEGGQGEGECAEGKDWGEKGDPGNIQIRWIFEKYDGIRAIWHPLLRILYSRWAKPLRVPYYVLDTFTSYLWLDGEISMRLNRLCIYFLIYLL